MAKIETSLNDAQVRIAEALFGTAYAVTLGKRDGAATAVPVPMADMPQAVWEYIVRYGVQRTYNDKVGGSDTTTEEKVAQVREQIEAHKRGEVRKVREGGGAMSEAQKALYAALKDALDTESRKAINKLEEKDQHAQLDALHESLNDAQKAAIAKLADAKIQAWETARKAKAESRATLSGLKINL
jgi:hypothetical protein